MIIIYLITFIISKNNNVLLIKIFTYVIDISIMITLLILCYYKKSEIKITIFIKDLIKLNRNKDYQYQKLIKEKNYNYVRYIKYIDEDIQLKIFNELNKIKLDSFYNQFSLDIYLLNLINPCYEIIYKAIEKKSQIF
jgi:hypothetical protein